MKGIPLHSPVKLIDTPMSPWHPGPRRPGKPRGRVPTPWLAPYLKGQGAMLHVEVRVQTWLTEAADPNDSWSRDSTGGAVTGVMAYHVPEGEVDKIRYRAESFDLVVRSGDVVHVVVADYESGDTFGRSGGQFEILDVFTKDDINKAIALARAAEAVPRSQFGFKCGGRDYHAGWTGYFERLQNIRVHSVVVQTWDGQLI